MPSCYPLTFRVSLEHKGHSKLVATARGLTVRIGLLYNRDIYANVALNALLPGLSKHHELALFYSERVGAAKQRDPRLDALILKETCFMPPSGHTFAELAHQAQSPEIGVTKINTDQRNLIEDFEPDLLVSIRFGQILHEQTIQLARLGVINLHSGLLPEYKGVMASFWSMMNSEKNLGTTLHWVTNRKIDTGHVISTRRQRVQTDLSYMNQVLSLYGPGVEQIRDAIENIERLAVTPRPDLPRGRYYSFPSTKEIDRFESAGWHLF